MLRLYTLQKLFGRTEKHVWSFWHNISSWNQRRCFLFTLNDWFISGLAVLLPCFPQKMSAGLWEIFKEEMLPNVQKGAVWDTRDPRRSTTLQTQVCHQVPLILAQWHVNRPSSFIRIPLETSLRVSRIQAYWRGYDTRKRFKILRKFSSPKDKHLRCKFFEEKVSFEFYWSHLHSILKLTHIVL